MATTIDRPEAPMRLEVGGFSRRRVFAVLLVGLAGTAAIAWLSNVEPLGVDTTATGFRPAAMIASSIDATSPQGDRFTQYTIPVRRGDSFWFLFWLHNDAPFPVTVTHVGDPNGWGRAAVDARIGPVVGSGAPSERSPYTIPAGEYARIEIRYRVDGCIQEDAAITFGAVPMSFRMFGVVPRSTSVTMPMTIELVGPEGASCGASG